MYTCINPIVSLLTQLFSSNLSMETPSIRVLPCWGILINSIQKPGPYRILACSLPWIEFWPFVHTLPLLWFATMSPGRLIVRLVWTPAFMRGVFQSVDSEPVAVVVNCILRAVIFFLHFARQRMVCMRRLKVIELRNLDDLKIMTVPLGGGGGGGQASIWLTTGQVSNKCPGGLRNRGKPQQCWSRGLVCCRSMATKDNEWPELFGPVFNVGMSF